MKPAGRIRGRDRPGRRTRKGPGENLVGAFGLASDFFEVGGEGFAVDASLIAADANKQRSIPGS